MWKILSLLAFAAVQVHGVDPVVGNQKLWEQVPYSGLQSNADYEASYAKYQVDEVPATASLVSCYTPQLRSNVAFTQETGYSDPGSSNCTQAELDAAKAAGDSVVRNLISNPYIIHINWCVFFSVLFFSLLIVFLSFFFFLCVRVLTNIR